MIDSSHGDILRQCAPLEEHYEAATLSQNVLSIKVGSPILDIIFWGLSSMSEQAEHGEILDSSHATVT